MHKVISVEELPINPFTMIGKEWMLITAGNINMFNMMTASWGCLGVLWNRTVAICFIRPHRYTYKFVNENNFFSLSFYPEEYRDALNVCGNYSGKDVDKVRLSGLTPVVDEEYKTIFFEESELALICKKIYFQDINPENFLDKSIFDNYPKKDYHRMFVGEIVKALKKE
ncbi:MAG: flavin reductase [Dictyoglomi bacterium]|jgi:flavin reductase (DIM6/NTAB) family NADH-FMN oxidoreductase RutF|nr:flavin reductase [Dictyoglomota bacterium]HHV81779.1 flavin reductase family protein [bacterium]HOK29853.1 flavin reductase [bacterium]HOL55284.1 flavin reductase [bacterium]HPC77834.1 flavin reductase [bacterium]